VIAFLVTAGAAFLMYLILTAGSGTIGFWSLSELIMGVPLAILTGLVSRKFLCRSESYRLLSPLRLLLLLIYVPVPFFIPG
jgi:multisubunit Na+/H+ antiporter MnhE subunit